VYNRRVVMTDSCMTTSLTTNVVKIATFQPDSIMTTSAVVDSSTRGVKTITAVLTG